MIVNFVSYIFTNILSIKFIGYLREDHFIGLMLEFHSFLELLKMFAASILIK